MKSIFENIQPRISPCIFSLAAEAEMTRTLINVVVWSHWGRAWSTHTREIASSFEAEWSGQGTKVRISLLGVRPRTVPALHTRCTVQWQFIDCSNSAGPCRPCSSHIWVTRWHCSELQASHWSASKHKHLSLANMNFSEFDENINYIKCYKNRVRFQKNDTWKVNGCQSECLW